MPEALSPPSFSRRARRLLGRALRRQCPFCGGGGVFESWFPMAARCPTCGLSLTRNEQGYAVGAYMFNIALAEIGFVICLIGGLLLTWPNPPWRLLVGVSLALMLVLPVALFPFSKTLFLGFDLLFNPATEDDRPKG